MPRDLTADAGEDLEIQITAKLAYLAFERLCLAARSEVAGPARTLSVRRKAPILRISPAPLLTEIEAAHLEAIRCITGPIYLETQFFRHLPIAEALEEAAVENPDLTCILTLPAAPEDVAFQGNRREDAQLGAQKQMEAIDVLAEGFGKRLALASPAQPVAATDGAEARATPHGAPIIYVHSKLSLFRLDQVILPSANLNGRSLH